MKKFRVHYYREVQGFVDVLAKDEEEATEVFSANDYDNEVEEEKNIDIQEIEPLRV